MKTELFHLLPTGTIHPNVFQEVCTVIAQFNGIKTDQALSDSKPPKFKNKLAKEMLAKIKKGAAELNQSQKEVQRMELPNIISAVASKHPRLNYTNIYDLTVTQLFDTFNRLCNNTSFDIHSMSIAAWGDKDNKFDYGAWYTIMHY